MCKSPDEPGGPYRCPGDMQKNLDRAQSNLEQAQVGVAEADNAVEDAQYAREALDEVDSPEDKTQEALQDRADSECDGSFESADKVAKDVADQGYYGVVEQSQNYNPENDYEGSRQFDSEECEVKVFGSQEELDEYLNDNGFDTHHTENGVYYGLDDRDVDFSTGEMETKTAFVTEPNGEKQVDPDAQREYDKAAKKADRDLANARKQQEAAQAKVRDARAKSAHAREQYEATPRGMGELQRDIDNAKRSGDDKTADYLQERLDKATATVNDEERERRDNAAQRGQDREYYNHAAMSTVSTGQHRPSEGDPEYNAEAVVQEAGITGSTRVYDRNNDGGSMGDMTKHKVTLTRTDEEGKRHEATFNYYTGSGWGKTPPSCSDVVSAVSSDSAGVDNAGGDFDTWASEYGMPTDKHEDPEGYRDAKRTFKASQENAERMEKFLGSERFERAKWGDEE